MLFYTYSAQVCAIEQMSNDVECIYKSEFHQVLQSHTDVIN